MRPAIRILNQQKCRPWNIWHSGVSFSPTCHIRTSKTAYIITVPYGADGEATIIRTTNLDHRHYLQAFVGGQFKVGVWQPRVNVGMMKEWLTLPVEGKPMKMNGSGFLFQ